MIKGKRGTFHRAMQEDGQIEMVKQEASIYGEAFAVYKDNDKVWHVDHVATGLRVCLAERKKDCVARVEALLAIPIDWTLDSNDALCKDMQSHPDNRDLYAVARNLQAD